MKILKIIRLLGIMLIAILILWIAGWNLYASHKEKQVREAWAKTLVPLDEIEKKFPPSTANATALELEKMAADMGFDLAPEKPGRPHPSEEAIKTKQNLYNKVGGYSYTFVEIQLDRPDDSLG